MSGNMVHSTVILFTYVLYIIYNIYLYIYIYLFHIFISHFLAI